MVHLSLRDCVHLTPPIGVAPASLPSAPPPCPSAAQALHDAAQDHEAEVPPHHRDMSLTPWLLNNNQRSCILFLLIIVKPFLTSFLAIVCLRSWPRLLVGHHGYGFEINKYRTPKGKVRQQTWAMLWAKHWWICSINHFDFMEVWVIPCLEITNGSLWCSNKSNRITIKESRHPKACWFAEICRASCCWQPL